jgi:hypothetical protein
MASQNYVEFGPSAGSSFTATNTFRIKLSSPNEFWVPQKSYLSFKITGATTDCNLTNLGGPAVIERLTTIVSGQEIETIAGYNQYCSLVYKRSPEEYQSQLKQLEFGDITATTGSRFFRATPAVNQDANGVVVHHAPRAAIFESHQQFVPLCFLKGGIELEITLASNAVACSNAAGTYTISDVRLNACMMQLPEAYLKSFQESLQGGSEAKLPLTCIRQFKIPVRSAGISQEDIVSVGYLKSVRSVIGSHRVDTEAAAGATAFCRDNLNNLGSYYWQVGSQRYPKNKEVRVFDSSATTGSAATSNEELMLSLCSIDNTYAHLNVPASKTTGAAVFFNFSSSNQHGSGVAIPDGQLRWTKTHGIAPLTTGTTELYVAYDALLRISAADVAIDTVSLS